MTDKPEQPTREEQPTFGKLWPCPKCNGDARYCACHMASPASTLTTGGEGLREAVFEILRRHDVSEQCFAEVAMVTFGRAAREGGGLRIAVQAVADGAILSKDEAKRILAALSPAPQADILETVREQGGKAVVTITNDGWEVRSLEAEAILARPDLAEALALHWMTGTGCSHDNGGSNTAACACGWVGTKQPNVGNAAKDWAAHALASLNSDAPVASQGGEADDGVVEAMAEAGEAALNEWLKVRDHADNGKDGWIAAMKAALPIALRTQGQDELREALTKARDGLIGNTAILLAGKNRVEAAKAGERLTGIIKDIGAALNDDEGEENAE